ncbi:hypothetical protein [Hyperthermus butylicus]|uniref:hypothetical protein n=1 Tax=Hyperthermus butylicus TaxID=54248 RepID=UPI0003223608|nr:hypothetical protein [Hyperthermus butylicus]
MSCCRDGYPREACDLLRILLEEYHNYFDKMGWLNSDGRGVFEKIVRMLLNSNPSLRRLIYKVRRKPTLESILRLAEEFYDCEVNMLASEYAI